MVLKDKKVGEEQKIHKYFRALASPSHIRTYLLAEGREGLRLAAMAKEGGGGNVR